MSNKPTLTLSVDDSRKLFNMLKDGAAPADLFETFDKEEAYYYLKAGMVVEDIKDPNNIVAQVITKLGGELPVFDKDNLPPGMDPNSLEAQLMLQSDPQAIAVINIGRHGEKRGFGFGSPTAAMDVGNHTSSFGSDGPDIGGLLGVDADGNLDESNDGFPNIPAPVKAALSAVIREKIMGGPNSSAAIRVAKISIEGGEGNGLSIEIEGLEMNDAEMAQTLIDSIKGISSEGK